MSKPTFPECRFLIPLRRDSEISDGKVHAAVSWRWLQRELRAAFGGFTKAPGVYEGTWENPKTGTAIRDGSVQYMVAVPTVRLNKLRSILRQACLRFGQQCIYLSVAGVVEFVERQDD